MEHEIRIVEGVETITFCRYARWLLRRQLRTFARELSAVQSSDEDSEGIHQMRVASRRIRSTLPVFSPCFGKQRTEAWRRSFRKITRALGEARDLDVQIAFVTEYRDRFFPGKEGGNLAFRLGYCYADLKGTSRTGVVFPENRFSKALTLFSQLFPKGTRGSASRDPGKRGPVLKSDLSLEGQGICCLLLRLKQKRQAVQQTVRESVREISESGSIEEISQHLYDVVQGKPGDKTQVDLDVFQKALSVAVERLIELLIAEPSLSDPRDVTGHHNFRIRIKWLRYTLESFSPLYVDRMKEFLAPLKEIQDTLGEIHDCDVWILMLPGFLGEEKARIQDFFGEDSLYSGIEPELLGMHSYIIRRRQALFETCKQRWDSLVRDRFIEKLIRYLESYAQIPVISLPGDAAGSGKTDQPRVFGVLGTFPRKEPDIRKVLNLLRIAGADHSIFAGAFPPERSDLAEWISAIRSGSGTAVTSRRIVRFLRAYPGRSVRKERKGQGRGLIAGERDRLSQDDVRWLSDLPPLLRIREGQGTVLVMGSGFLPKKILENLVSSEERTRVLHRLFPVDALVIGGVSSWRSRQSGDALVIEAGPCKDPADPPGTRAAVLRLTPHTVDIVTMRESPGPSDIPGREGPLISPGYGGSTEMPSHPGTDPGMETLRGGD